MIGYDYGYPMMGYGYDTFWWLHVLFQVFWVVILIAVIVMAIRWMRGGKMLRHHPHGGHSAIDLLKERYVKGEISREEFEEKKRDIS